MKLRWKVILLWAIVIASIRYATAQVPDPPRYWVAAGAGYNGAATGIKVGGLLSFGVRLTPTTYSYTTNQTGALGSSMRSGIATVLYRSTNVNLLGLVDAGMATGAGGSIGAAFSGGGVAAFRVDRWTKQPNTHVAVDFRVNQNNAAGQPSKPVISFMIGKEF